MALIGIAALFFFALFAATIMQARYVAEPLGINGYRWSLRWTRISLVIPVLNFVRPWLGFAEIHRSIFSSLAERSFGSAWNRGFSFATFAFALSWLGRYATAAPDSPYGLPQSGHPAPALTATVIITLVIAVVISLAAFIYPYVYVTRLYFGARRLLRLAEGMSAAAAVPQPA